MLKMHEIFYILAIKSTIDDFNSHLQRAYSC
jgi:hypothetical protein